MLIHNIKSTFIYSGGSEFDLINPPEISNYKLYVEYSNFINNIVAIYGNQRSDERIPIFWTKQQSNDTILRVADPDSTLRSLIPGNIYYIICLNDTVLPFQIPETTNAKNFLKIDPPKIGPTFAVCENIVPVSTQHRNINLSKESGSILPLSIDISGIFPNNNYYYTISPIFSNWPATITQMSGFLERGGPTGVDGLVSSSIKTIVSYESCETISECTGNIPYSLIDTDNNYFNKNIFTLLNLNIYDEISELVFTDTINIQCDDCIPLLDYKIGKIYNPILTIDQPQYELSGSNFVNVIASYDKVNPFKTYTYHFDSLGANWPCRIRNASGSFVPEHVYKDSDGKIYGSGTIGSIFTFATSSWISDPSWANLNYALETYSDEAFIKNNLYAVLVLKIKDDDVDVSSCFTSVRCLDCFPEQIDCSALSLKINNTNLSYSTLTDTSRPGAEITLQQSCCDQDQHIYVDISGACSNSIYSYKFDSYPNILISPSSGNFSFSSASGRISAVANLNGQKLTTIQFTAKHSGDNTFATDSMIMRCRPIEITASGNYVINNSVDGSVTSNIIRELNGKYYLSPDLDTNGSYYWSKNAQDSWPRIWNPGSSILPPPSDNYWFISTNIYNTNYYTTGNLYPNTPLSLDWKSSYDLYEFEELPPTFRIFDHNNYPPSWASGTYVLYTGVDINSKNFYSKDGQDSWPRIWNPGTGLLYYYESQNRMNFQVNNASRNDLFGDIDLLWFLSELPPLSGLTVPETPPRLGDPIQGFDYYFNSGIYPLLPRIIVNDNVNPGFYGSNEIPPFLWLKTIPSTEPYVTTINVNQFQLYTSGNIQ
jgi:hypothetical protein